jgi:glyoxylase-like metal-dependent hydrolase (beta-lactamase superfamily II)
LRDFLSTRWLSRSFKTFAHPKLDLRETALSQVQALGFKREDVRHIVLTHLDMDHAAGISDFPQARIHISRIEHEAAVQRLTALEKSRYRPLQWAHQPHWALYETHGERWNDFDSVRLIDEGLPEILLVPLIGHTRGHSGVAVRNGEGWLLHAGDAYFHHSEADPIHPPCPKMLSVFQTLMQHDGPTRLENQTRLRALVAQHGTQVRVFCAHDPVELHRFLGK